MNRNRWTPAKTTIASICSWVACLALLIGSSGCMHIGPPSEADQAEYNFWSKADGITPRERDRITTDASQHTDWTNKQKMIWSTEQFKRIVSSNQLKAKKSRHRATTGLSPAHPEN